MKGPQGLKTSPKFHVKMASSHFEVLTKDSLSLFLLQWVYYNGCLAPQKHSATFWFEALWIFSNTLHFGTLILYSKLHIWGSVLRMFY